VNFHNLARLLDREIDNMSTNRQRANHWTSCVTTRKLGQFPTENLTKTRGLQKMCEIIDNENSLVERAY